MLLIGKTFEVVEYKKDNRYWSLVEQEKSFEARLIIKEDAEIVKEVS